MAIPSTYSHQGITLVRGTSCSLVDIPTYLGPASVGIAGKSGVTTTTVPISALAPRPPRPRLQLDLTKKNYSAKSTRKTKWTILCVGLTLLTMCVTLVGTMLSIGSQYSHENLQKIGARKWDHEFRNKSGFNNNNMLHHSTAKSNLRSTTVTTMSPLFARLKEISKDKDEEDSPNEIIQNAVNTDGKAPVGYRGKILRSLGSDPKSASHQQTNIAATSGHRKKKTS